jgi:hypothetical protein
MINLCAPALIYLAFSLTQIIIDTFKGLYNTAFFKFIVMIIITILLNALCISGMGIISWIIVFIPFILMSVIVTILLYVFGLDPATGKLNVKCDNTSSSSSNNTSSKSGNLIYSSTTVNTKNKYIDTSYSETPLDEYDHSVDQHLD